MTSEIGAIAPDKDLRETFQQIREDTLIDFELNTGLFDDAVGSDAPLKGLDTDHIGYYLVHALTGFPLHGFS